MTRSVNHENRGGARRPPRVPAVSLVEAEHDEAARLFAPAEIRGSVAATLEHAVRYAREWDRGIAAQATDTARTSGGDSDTDPPGARDIDPRFVAGLAERMAGKLEADREIVRYVRAMLANVTAAGQAEAERASGQTRPVCESCHEAGLTSDVWRRCVLTEAGVTSPRRWCRACYRQAVRLGRLPTSTEVQERDRRGTAISAGRR